MGRDGEWYEDQNELNTWKHINIKNWTVEADEEIANLVEVWWHLWSTGGVHTGSTRRSSQPADENHTSLFPFVRDSNALPIQFLVLPALDTLTHRVV